MGCEAKHRVGGVSLYKNYVDIGARQVEAGVVAGTVIVVITKNLKMLQT